jgi:hypothetical protein
MNDVANERRDETPHIASLALRSARRFVALARTHSLCLRRARRGALYHLGSRGDFAVFRETVRLSPTHDRPVVLVVGFRLRWIDSFATAHWLFQRCCILTTPFWSGFTGFRVKLWMVDPVTRNYLGIYEWDGRASAQKYVDALVRVLKPLSVPGSVWYELIDEQFAAYLSDHRSCNGRR